MIVTSIFIFIVAMALFTAHIPSIHYTRLTSIVLLFSGLLAFNALHIDVIASGLGLYSGLFQLTNISQGIELFIYITAAVILVPWAAPYVSNDNIQNSNSKSTSTLSGGSAPVGDYLVTYSVKNNINNLGINATSSLTLFVQPLVSEYSLIILFTTLGASLLISSSDLVSMYLSIELQSFAVYILAAVYKHSESATSAGLKYFLLGGLSSCLILLGSGLIYSYTGLTQLDSIYSLISVSLGTGSSSISQGFLLGLIIIFTGFLFKISAAPFHNWAPDVYDDVPTMVTTWLTIMPKISIVMFLLELQSGTGINLDTLSILYSDTSFNVLKNLLLISSLLSLIIGTIVGLAQTKIKRLLAYSTISHVGFLLLALAINTEQSIESLIFYLIQYTLTNLNTFFILLAFGYIILNSVNSKESEIKYISELKGQFLLNPLLSLSLALCLFSMAGIPPLIGFFAKQQVLYAATHSGYYFLSIVAILVSVISASYYLSIIKVMHFESPNLTSLNSKTQLEALEITNIHSFIIATSSLIMLCFIIKPTLLLNSTHLLALNLFTT